MNSMEIERKFTVKEVPADLEKYSFHQIEQAYLNTNPVIRVRRQDEDYYLTYKGKGLLAREEYNLPLNQQSYEHLSAKADGHIIKKRRYLIPIGNSSLGNPLTLELDIFEEALAPLIIAEVEFASLKEADSFTPPDWCLEDVTNDPSYHNSNMIYH